MEGFVPAQRGQVYLKVAMSGVTGSGKSMSSLLLARGLVGEHGRIAVADSEGGRASLYAGAEAEGGVAQFDTLRIRRPFSPHKYIEAIELALDGGYDCIVFDSLSHAWAYEGGILDHKEQLDEEQGESFGNWRLAKRPHSELVLAILGSPIHLIGTMRSKMEYQFEKDSQGKTSVKKLGLAPMQSQDLPFEFDILCDIAEDHSVSIGKDRTRTLGKRLPIITAEHGILLRRWLEQGNVPEQQAPIDVIPAVEPAQGNAAVVLNFTVRQSVERSYGGKTYSLLVGDAYVVRVPRLTQNKAAELTAAQGQVEVHAAPSGQTIRVGERDLPVYLAAQWQPKRSQQPILEVTANGQR